jgi:N-acetylglucosaminyldiphosphoundecaprenol N-acetyl-beta-D-mannosaminyltransferase
VGVGGTFDYWAGNIRRAPKLFQILGVEWVWRLVQEPKRIGRIFKAVVVFPVLALVDRVRRSA